MIPNSHLIAMVKFIKKKRKHGIIAAQNKTHPTQCPFMLLYQNRNQSSNYMV